MSRCESQCRREVISSPSMRLEFVADDCDQINTPPRSTLPISSISRRRSSLMYSTFCSSIVNSCCFILFSGSIFLSYGNHRVHSAVAVSNANHFVQSWSPLKWPVEEDSYYQHRHYYSPAYFPSPHKSARRIVSSSSSSSSSSSASKVSSSPDDHSSPSSLTDLHSSSSTSASQSVPHSSYDIVHPQNLYSSDHSFNIPSASLLLPILEQQQESQSQSNDRFENDHEPERNRTLEKILSTLVKVSDGHYCPPNPDRMLSDLVEEINGKSYIRSPSYSILPKVIQNRYNLTATRVDLLSKILSKYDPVKDDSHLLHDSFYAMISRDMTIVQARIMWLEDNVRVGNLNDKLDKDQYELRDIRMSYYYDKQSHLTKQKDRIVSPNEPWLQFSDGDQEPIFQKLWAKRYIRTNLDSFGGSSGTIDEKCPKFANWTIAYYSCDSQKWLFSYTSLIINQDDKSSSICFLKGIISVDLDISKLDINQCDHDDFSSSSSSSHSQTKNHQTKHKTHRMVNRGQDVSGNHYSENVIRENSQDKIQHSSHRFNNFHDVTIPLYGTHKCHHASSKCIFHPGHGWRSGGYICECREGFYSSLAPKQRYFNGTDVEKAWTEKMEKGSIQYDMIYVCQRCSEGCTSCNDASACLSSYNWAFRVSLLTFSILCIFFTGVLAGYIYKYRKLKVFKVASPIFLCITLLGCAMMYAEMAAIFPVLSTSACIATKVTRNMGFCITYSALLLKTWRVSLTYRVKSAHKLKLTDKQLLQWLFPILLVMAIYLGTWTISDPPEPHYIKDWNDLKFKICRYNWWDHSLVIGESIFLLWGIKVCYNVRNAESFFNEAKYITWAIYNIAVVNIIMILVHLLILPNAGPDGKYFFGFIRTQLSTTITVILIFGPKFYRVIKGQGDSWDNRVRARGVNASFSLNGVGLVHEETTDLYQENEELKEEIHKLATQIELMKLMQMEINNRHLKPKHGTSGHHILPTVTITANPTSAASVTQSPIVKAVYSRFDANDAPSPRISPAAELASERV